MRITSISCVSGINYLNNLNRENNKYVTNFHGKNEMVKGISSINDVVSIFGRQASEVPLGLNLKVSPSNGKILGFSKRLENGNLLNVIKTGYKENGKNFLYVSFKELKNDKPVSNIGISIESAEIIKLQNGKPSILEGGFVFLNKDSDEYMLKSRKLDNYLKQLGTHDNYQENATTIEVLRAQKTTQIKKQPPMNVEQLYKISDEMPTDAEFRTLIQRDVEMGNEESLSAQSQFYKDAGKEYNNFYREIIQEEATEVGSETINQ